MRNLVQTQTGDVKLTMSPTITTLEKSADLQDPPALLERTAAPDPRDLLERTGLPVPPDLLEQTGLPVPPDRQALQLRTV
jgi:hypothetical protein